MSPDLTHTAATIIARARDAYGDADAFDFRVAAEGIAPFGGLYNETYSIANTDHLVRPGDDESVMAERKDRAATLWEQILPELERYAESCRTAKYTGWSKESSGPIRRVR
ncbi:hypothetical protein [Spirillospora sp. CA-294931]|uniref:hypothetical protein n=1 Tax=Spirillospora sp. CA-294931 TaxID=3240042 RepID=UPI003D8E6046